VDPSLITEMLECVANLAIQSDTSAEQFAEQAIRVYCDCVGVKLTGCEIVLEVEEKEPAN
jgi:hypothetical protein